MVSNTRRKITRREFAILTMAVVSFSVVYFGVFLPYLFSNMPFNREIKAFSIKENEWFDGSVRITNNFRPNFVVTNDELAYEVTYSDKKSTAITIKPELDIMYGGTIVSSFHDQEPIVLEPDIKKRQSIIFHTNNAGGNQILFAATIQNTTDGTFLGRVTTTINIGVFSQAEALQFEANQNTSLGVWVSLGIGIVTTIGLIATLQFTRKQTAAALEQTAAIVQQNQLLKDQVEITRDEMNKTLRPWIGRMDVVFEGVLWDDGEFTSEKDFEMEVRTRQTRGTPSRTTHHRFIYWIQNYGRLPAINCVSSYAVLTYRGKAENYRNPDPSELDKLPFSDSVTVMPNEKVPLRLNIPIDNITYSVVICRIKYDYPNGMGRYDFMMKYDGSNWVPIYNKIE